MSHWYRPGEDEPDGQNTCQGCGCKITSGNVCSAQCSRKVAAEEASG